MKVEIKRTTNVDNDRDVICESIELTNEDLTEAAINKFRENHTCFEGDEFELVKIEK